MPFSTTIFSIFLIFVGRTTDDINGAQVVQTIHPRAGIEFFLKNIEVLHEEMAVLGSPDIFGECDEVGEDFKRLEQSRGGDGTIRIHQIFL